MFVVYIAGPFRAPDGWGSRVTSTGPSRPGGRSRGSEPCPPDSALNRGQDGRDRNRFLLDRSDP